MEMNGLFEKHDNDDTWMAEYQIRVVVFFFKSCITFCLDKITARKYILTSKVNFVTVKM